MHRTAVALALTLALAAPALAKRAPAPEPGFRAATADAVVVGKVTGLAAKPEKADMFKGDTREITVATVKVETALLGKPGTTVKVGFFLPQQGPGGRPARFIPASLSKDQEACLFLTKHPTKKGIFVLLNDYDVIDKKNNTEWKSQVEDVKKSAKLITEPMKGLKSKDAAERLLTAALLVNRYKAQVTGAEKTETVPAAESKLILTTLAEADWDARGGNYRAQPLTLFYSLGVTAKEGWNQPRDFKQINAEAKKWLKDNAGKYKMTRVVREKLGGAEEPE